MVSLLGAFILLAHVGNTVSTLFWQRAKLLLICIEIEALWSKFTMHVPVLEEFVRLDFWFKFIMKHGST